MESRLLVLLAQHLSFISRVLLDKSITFVVPLLYTSYGNMEMIHVFGISFGKVPFLWGPLWLLLSIISHYISSPFLVWLLLYYTYFHVFYSSWVLSYLYYSTCNLYVYRIWIVFCTLHTTRIPQGFFIWFNFVQWQSSETRERKLCKMRLKGIWFVCIHAHKQCNMYV